jgi:DNA-binding NarL/FixJ family response regulator
VQQGATVQAELDEPSAAGPWEPFQGPGWVVYCVCRCKRCDFGGGHGEVGTDHESRQLRKIRAILVDDHPVFAEGLKEGLEQTGTITVVGVAQSGYTALELMRQLDPDVVVLDMRLPGLSGMAVAEQARTVCPRAAVLMLSGLDGPESATTLLRLGVRGFLSKTASADAIASAVQVVANGGTLLGTLMPSSGFPTPDGLTPRESEVLQLLIAGCRNVDIAFRLGIALHTVESHVRQVLHKRGAKSRWELRGLAHTELAATTDIDT